MGLFKSNIIAGISACKHADRWHYGLVEVKVSDSDVVLTQHGTEDSINSLAKITKKEAVLCVATGSILSIESEESDPDKFLQTILPGSSTSDFFIQKSQTDNRTIEITNSSDLNSLLEELTSAGIEVTAVVLEKNALLAVQDASESDVYGSHYSIDHNGSFNNLNEHSNERISIDGFDLLPEQTLALGAVLTHHSSLAEEWNTPATVLNNKSRSKGKEKVKLVGALCVLMVLLASITNLFFFQKYADEVAQLDSILIASNASQERLEALKNRVQLQENLFSSINTIEPTQGAFLLDKIGQMLPEQITLSYLAIEPPQKIKAKKQILFGDGQIVIEGSTISSLALNVWMKDLNDLESIKDIELLAYEDNIDNKGKFKLSIELVNA